MTITRKYHSKDVEMIVSTSTIIETAIKNKTFLQSKRSTWADPFFENIKTRIDIATENYLGVDSAKTLRESTATIKIISGQVLRQLAEVKIQVEEDFKEDTTRRNELLTQLGFTKYHKAAQRADQEALINLLFQFKKSLTPALKNEIVEKGTAAEIVDSITNYATELKNADITQESNKGTKKGITAEAVKEFNEIYNAVISICKIAAKFYKDDPVLRSQFSYNKVSKALNAIGKPATPSKPDSN